MIQTTSCGSAGLSRAPAVIFTALFTGADGDDAAPVKNGWRHRPTRFGKGDLDFRSRRATRSVRVSSFMLTDGQLVHVFRRWWNSVRRRRFYRRELSYRTFVGGTLGAVDRSATSMPHGAASGIEGRRLVSMRYRGTRYWTNLPRFRDFTAARSSCRLANFTDNRISVGPVTQSLQCFRSGHSL